MEMQYVALKTKIFPFFKGSTLQFHAGLQLTPT